MQSVNAVSLTANVNGWLANSRSARILHIFDQACNLINEQGDVLSLVTQQIGNGPFHLVVDDNILFSEHIDLESSITHLPHQIVIGNIAVNAADADLWNPRPDWNVLHLKRDRLAHQMEQFPITNYLRLGGLPITQSPVSSLQLSTTLPSSIAIADLPACLTAVKKLVGLGPGLTPSGDDFIMGALHAAWIIHPYEIASPMAQVIADTAAPLTTSLSAAWLRSAGRGEAGILWHELFDALISSDDQQIQHRIDKILSTGASSGADAFAGFISTLNSYVELERKHVNSKYIWRQRP